MKKMMQATFVFSLALTSAVYATQFNKNRILKKSQMSIEKSDVAIKHKNAINLNTATVNSLIQLKGIGSKRAKDIVAYRNMHGPFKQMDDLALVNGFNKKFMKRIIKKNATYKILV